uniref:hypothetical protein n=1 Tax=Chamaesiphon sp. OTE_75_metabat_556 TaxID=2964692 RepID=UPI002869F1C5
MPNYSIDIDTRSRSVSTAIDLIYDSGMLRDGCWWIRWRSLCEGRRCANGFAESLFGFDRLGFDYTTRMGVSRIDRQPTSV